MIHQQFATSSDALDWVESYEVMHGIKARYSPLLVSFAIAHSTKIIPAQPVLLRERRLHSTARIHGVCVRQKANRTSA